MGRQEHRLAPRHIREQLKRDRLIEIVKMKQIEPVEFLSEDAPVVPGQRFDESQAPRPPVQVSRHPARETFTRQHPLERPERRFRCHGKMDDIMARLDQPGSEILSDVTRATDTPIGLADECDFQIERSSAVLWFVSTDKQERACSHGGERHHPAPEREYRLSTP